MNRMIRRKILITIVVLAALPAVVVGVVAVQAQDPQPQPLETLHATSLGAAAIRES
jgi:ABC-type phosphate transport system permease subunit